jgi:hypothetical protein
MRQEAYRFLPGMPIQESGVFASASVLSWPLSVMMCANHLLM